MKLLLYTIFLIALLYVDAASDVPKPRICQRYDSLFQMGKEYTYSYVATVETGVIGTTDSKSGFQYRCVIRVASPRKCEAILRVVSCRLYEREAKEMDGQPVFVLLSSSDGFNQLITRYPVYFQMSKGQVRNETIVMSNDEVLEISNIKRAMLTALQLPSMKRSERKKHLNVIDINGECPVDYTIRKSGKKSEVSSHRDITHCLMPQIYEYQLSLFSFVKQVNGGFRRSKTTELLYPFSSVLDCKHHKSGLELNQVDCIQSQSFESLAYNGTVYATAQANITQHLKLKSTTRGLSKHIDRSLEGKHIASIEFEFELDRHSSVTSKQIFDAVFQMASTFIADDVTSLPGRFVKAVHLMRSGTEAVLEHVMPMFQECYETRQCDRKKQAVMQLFYIDCLSSCGSAACISEIARHLVSTKKAGTSVNFFLFDISMHHSRPAAKTVKYVLHMCEEHRTQNCLLLLSAIIRNYADGKTDAELQQHDGPVYQSLQHIRSLLGDQCKSGHGGTAHRFMLGTQEEQDEHILTTIKALGNLGWLVQSAYDRNPLTTKPLVSTLLTCAKSRDLSDYASNAAILALQKMNMDSDIRDAMWTIISDPSRSNSQRTNAFTVLVRDEDKSTVRMILDLLHRETWEHMKIFIHSYVQNIQESEEPRYQNLRKIWEEVLKADSRPLPDLKHLLYQKSHYTEVSRQFFFPLIGQIFGVQLETTVVYEPGSFVPHQMSFNLTLHIGGTVYNVIEVGSDQKGMDFVLDGLFGPDGPLPKDASYLSKIKLLMGLLMQNETSLNKMAQLVTFQRAAMERLKKMKEQQQRGILPGGAGLPPGIDPSMFPGGKIPPGAIPPEYQHLLKGAKESMANYPIPPEYSHLVKTAVTPGGNPGGRGFPGGMGGMGGGSPEVMEAFKGIIKLLLFEPDLSFLDEQLMQRHKEMMREVNYPRVLIPSGMAYIKLMGNELGFLSTKGIMRYIRKMGSSGGFGGSINPHRLMEQLQRGQNFIFSLFAKYLDLRKSLPSIAGVSMNMTLDGATTMIFDGRVQANIAGMVAMKQPLTVSFNAKIRASFTFLGEMLFKVPTVDDGIIGLRMNASTDADLGLSFGVQYANKKVKLHFNNIEKPQTMFHMQGHMHLQHLKYLEYVEGTVNNRSSLTMCSPEHVQVMTGRKLCLEANYQNSSGSTIHPYFPLTGPVDAKIVMYPVDSKLKTYNISAGFHSEPYTRDPEKPEQVERVHLLNVNYTAPGEKYERKVDLQLKYNINASEFILKTWLPERDNSEATIRIMPEPSSKEYRGLKIITDIRKAGKTVYAFMYEREKLTTYEELSDAKTSQVFISPITTLRLHLNMTVPDLSFDINVEHIKAKAGNNVNTSIDAAFFCNRKESPLYSFHPDVKAAERNGYRSTLHIKNKAVIKTGSNEWQAVDLMNIQYPGQNMNINNTLWTEKKKKQVFRDTTITFINEDNKLDKVRMHSHGKNSSTRGRMKYDYTINIDYSDQYHVDILGGLEGTAANVHGDTDLIFKRLSGAKRRRSKRSWHSIKDWISKTAETYRAAVTYDDSKASDVSNDAQTERMLGDAPQSSPDTSSFLHLFDTDKWKAKVRFDVQHTLRSADQPDGPRETKWQVNITYPRNRREQQLRFHGDYDHGVDAHEKGYRINVTSTVEHTHANKKLEMSIGAKSLTGQHYASNRVSISDLTTNQLMADIGGKLDYVQGKRIHMSRYLHFPMVNVTYEMFGERLEAEGYSMRAGVVRHIWMKRSPMSSHSYNASVYLHNKHLTIDHHWETHNMSARQEFEAAWDLPNNAITVDGKGSMISKADGARISKMKLEFRKSDKQKPSLKVIHTQVKENVITTVDGRLLNPKLCKVTVNTQNDGQERVEVLNWYLEMLNPHKIKHRFKWQKSFGDKMRKQASVKMNHVYGVASETVITLMGNVGKNVTNWTLPFLNQTVGYYYRENVMPIWRGMYEYLGNVTVSNKPIGKYLLAPFKFTRGLVIHAQQTFWQSFPAQLLLKYNVREKVHTLFHDRLPAILRRWKKEPPYLAWTVYKKKLQPYFDEAFNDSKAEFNSTHMFVWNSFNEKPYIPRSAKLWMSYLFHALPVFQQQKISLKGLGFKGMIFGRDQMLTFDGKLFTMPEYRGDHCSYLMASDFKGAKFSLIKSAKKLVFYSKHLSIGIDSDNRVSVNGSLMPSDLPIYGHNGKLLASTNGAYVTIHAPHGVRLTCDTVLPSCLISLSAVHFNQSLGLLGSNDNEQGSDFRIPSGSVTRNVHHFINKYQMHSDSSDQCHVNEGQFVLPPANPDMTPCGRKPSSQCTDMFAAPKSPLAVCFPWLSPRQIKIGCDIGTSRCDREPRKHEYCSYVRAYVSMCRARGVAVAYPSACVRCGHKSMGATWTVNVHRSVDVIIVQSRHVSVAKSDIMKKIGDFLSKLKFRQPRYGLISYGGDGMMGHPAVAIHTFNGHLFGDKAQLLSAMMKLKPSHQPSRGGFEAIEKTAHYPYKPQSHRLVLVFSETSHMSPVRSLTYHKLSADLTANGIKMNVFSHYPALKQKRVLGMKHDGMLIMTRKVHGTRNRPPFDDYGRLIYITKGALFHMDTVREAHRRHINELHKFIQSQVTPASSSADTACHVCQCVPGQAGESVTKCHPGKC